MDELLREIRELLADIKAQLVVHATLLRALVAQPSSVAAGDPEEPEAGELGTWLLTDEQVERVERAILEEQRVRGKAYGGS